MNDQPFILFCFAAVSAALIVAAMVRPDRGLFFGWVVFSVLSTLLIIIEIPLLGVICLVALLFAARLVINNYNRMMFLNQSADCALHDVSVSQMRRQSILPRLEIYTTRYCGHERGTLIGTTRARGRGAHLLALAERYPALQASHTFMQLASALVTSENEIRVARLRHNEAIRTYNSEVTRFPNVLFARALGFGPRRFLPQWL